MDSALDARASKGEVDALLRMWVRFYVIFTIFYFLTILFFAFGREVKFKYGMEIHREGKEGNFFFNNDDIFEMNVTNNEPEFQNGCVNFSASLKVEWKKMFPRRI